MMKKIFLAIAVLSTFAASAQGPGTFSDLVAKTIRIGGTSGNKIVGTSKDTALAANTDDSLVTMKAIRQFVLNHAGGTVVPGWNLTGNTGTTAGTNFIGSIDFREVVFKANNIESGRIGLSSGNTSFGWYSLISNTSGAVNTSFGSQALTANTTGGFDTGFGAGALQANTTGGNNTADGTNSLYRNITGGNNTAVGQGALYEHLSGFDNTAVGNAAAPSLTTGSRNTIIGSSATTSSATVRSSVALGYGASAGNNQFALSDSIKRLKFKGLANGLGYILKDTTGLGDFVPRPDTTGGTGGSGEVNTASNLGTGTGIFDSKSGVDLRFNSLSTTDFSLASNVFSINYTNAPTASGSVRGLLTAADWTTFNNKVSFTSALARAAVSLTTTGSGAATYNSTTGVFNIPTPSGAPSGAAGGSLTGTYPNPTIGAGAVGSSQIATGAVAAFNIANLAVINGKIADNAVDVNKLADDAVNNLKLQDNAVGTSKIAADAVTTEKIANTAVTYPKIKYTYTRNEGDYTMLVDDDVISFQDITGDAVLTLNHVARQHLKIVSGQNLWTVSISSEAIYKPNGTPFGDLLPGSSIEIVWADRLGYWILVNKIVPIASVSGIDLSVGDYTITRPGIYEIAVGSSGFIPGNLNIGVDPADYAGEEGSTITIINTDAVNTVSVNAFSGFPVAVLGSSTTLSTMPTESMYVLTPSNGLWRAK